MVGLNINVMKWMTIVACTALCTVGWHLTAGLGQDAAKELHAGSNDRLPRNDLLVYRDADRRLVRANSTDEWLKRRAEILVGMQAVMGPLPGDEKRCPLEMEIHEEADCGKYVRRLISYASEPNCRVSAYLLVPKQVLSNLARRTPAVLCLHPTDNRIGHQNVVGLGGKSNRQYASELAERGYVALAPSYPLLAKYQPDLKKFGWESGTMKAIWDNIRGLDLLESLPFVEGKKFGAIGHSLGAHNAIFTAVFDQRIAVVVSSCGFDSFLDYGGGKEPWTAERGWAQSRYMPRIADYRGRLTGIPFDFYEVVAAIAPRRLLAIAPKHDHNFQADSVDKIVEAVRPVFELYDEGDALQVEHPDCNHEFPPAMRQLAYELIDEVLR